MSVEFLSGDGPETQPTRPRSPRRRKVVVGGAVALLVVAGVTTSALHHGGSPSGSATPTRMALPSVPTPSPTADPCRDVPECGVTTAVPLSLRRLARAYLPAGVRLSVRTVRSAGSLVSRDVDALVDSVRIVVRVQRGGPTEREIVPDPPGVGSVLLHATNRGFTVRVQYLAPSTVPPRTDRLRALLRDPRLTA